MCLTTFPWPSALRPAFRFYESLVGRHKSLEHWRDEFGRIGRRRLAARFCKDLGVGNKVTVNACRKLDGDFDRAIVLKGGEFELRYDGSFVAP